MNNQAAQTMPEPIAAMIEQVSAVESLIDDASRQYHDSTRWTEEPSVYDDRSSPTLQEAIDAGFNKLRDMLRDYALSQTAGVVLARGWFHALPDEDDYEFHDDASGAGKNCDGCIRAVIVAAPAASGGEDDMCPNCVTPWKCNGPHESPAAAPVSERARESMECVCPSGSGCTNQCDRGWRRILSEARALPPSSRGNVLDFIEREMEQALTQQRGEAAAHASGVPGRITDSLVSTVEAAMHACYMDHDDYRLTTALLHDMAVAAVKVVSTTPQPGADAVRDGIRSLIDRVRPGSEAAPWVVRELESLLGRGG